MKTTNFPEIVNAHILSDDSNAAIYVGTYRKYNDGSLAGAWLDLTTFTDSDEFFEVCAALHADESDPEYMFQDYMNFPENLYGESMSGDDIQKIIDWAQMDDDDKDILAGWIEVTGNNDADLETAKDHYMGNYSDFVDFAEQIMQECYEIPANLANYIDYEAFARDLKYDYYHAENGNIYSAC